jgi:capsular polysaccharide biosynthesis protein
LGNCLPACLPLLKFYETIEQTTILLVPEGLNRWQIRHLELLGYTPEHYSLYLSETLCCENLLIPSWHKDVIDITSAEQDIYSRPPAPSVIEWMNKRALKNLTHQQKYSIDSKSTAKKIFISRRDSNKIRVSNESASQHLVETEFGVIVVTLSELTVDQQIAVFHNAEVVIGIHGAGFTNLLYSNAPRVLEIFEPDHELKFFSTLTNVVGGKHYSFFAEDSDSDGSVTVNIEILNWS